MTFQSSVNLALTVLSSFLVAFRGQTFRSLQSMVSHREGSLKLCIVMTIVGNVCPAPSFLYGVGILYSQLLYSASGQCGNHQPFPFPRAEHLLTDEGAYRGSCGFSSFPPSFRILALQENFLLQFKMDVSGEISLDGFLLPLFLYVSGKKEREGR